MDSARQPIKRQSTIRIAGVNAPGVPQIQREPIQTPNVQDTTQQSFENAFTNVSSMFETEQKRLQSIAEARQAELMARGRPERGAALQGIAQAIAQGAVLLQERSNKKREMELALAEEEAKMQEEQRTMILRGAVEEQIVNLSGRIYENGFEEGLYTTRRDVQRLIQEDFADLPPSVREDITSYFNTRLGQLFEQAGERNYNQFQELQDATANALSADIRMQLINRFIPVLTNQYTSAETRDEAFSQAMAFIGESTAASPLDPVQKLNLMADALESLMPAMQQSGTGAYELTRRLAGVQQLATEIPALRAQYGSDDTGFNLAVASRAHQLGIPEFASMIESPNQVLEGQMRRQTQQQEFRQAMYNENLRRLVQENPDIASAYIASQAWEFYNNPSVARAAMAFPSEIDTQAFELSKQFAAWRNDFTTTLDQIGVANEQLQAEYRLQVGDQQFQLQYNSTTGRLDVTPTSVQVPAGYNSRSIDYEMFSRLGIDAPPAVLQQLQAGDILFLSAPSTSPAEIQARQERLTNLHTQLVQTQQAAARMGFDVANPTNQQYITPLLEKRDSFQRLVNAEAANTPAAPNFDLGNGIPNVPYQALRETPEGLVLPFSSDSDAVITSNYGMRNGQWHAGTDIGSAAASAGRSVPVLSLTGGTVIQVDRGHNGGFGETVVVRAPNGYIEQYSHLAANSARVSPGEQIPPGLPIGIMGQTGSSRGTHLHFQVYEPGVAVYTNQRNGTVNPIEYMRTIAPSTVMPVPNYTGVQQNQINTPPSVPGGVPINNETFILPVTPGVNRILDPFDTPTTPSVPAQSVYPSNGTNPMDGGLMPITKDSYHIGGDGSENFGYEWLKNDREARIELARLSGRLNIPAIWLADVMDYESSGRLIWGGTGNNHFGLIQISRRNLIDLGYNPDTVGNMTRGQYIRGPMRDYLARYSSRINTIEDLYMSIQGPAYLSLSPEERAQISDGRQFSSHMRRMGNRAGRHYRTSYSGDFTSSQSVHTQTVAGCPTCQNLAAQRMGTIPHYGLA